MNCGVLCVRRLAQFLKWDDALAMEAERRTDERGLSLFDLAELLEKQGLETRIHQGRIRKITNPGFLLAEGHYLLLMKREGWFYYLYDPNLGDFRLLRPFLFVTGYQYFLEVVI